MNVISLISDKEMAWPTALRPVATMADEETIRNLSVRENPGSDMREYGLLSSANLSVPIMVKAPSPHPARSKPWAMRRPWPVLIYKSPEPFWERDGKTLRKLRMLFKYWHRLVHLPACVTGAAGISFGGYHG